MARGLKFCIQEGEGLYYPSSENKGADQLRGYREADLRLCFRICKNPVFSRRGSLVYPCTGVCPSSVRNFKHLPNCLITQSHLWQASMDRWNGSLFLAFGSHDKIVATLIYGKTCKNIPLQHRWSDFYETWHVASGTRVHCSLLKWWLGWHWPILRQSICIT